MDLCNFCWLGKMAARDFIVNFTMIVFWQWLIIESSHAKNIRPLKFNKDYQDRKHIQREMIYCVSTTLCGTFWEAVIMYMYAVGYVNTWTLDYKTNYGFWALVVLNSVWRDGHFYFVHRAMHDWDTEYIPDVGKWLYRVAHSLHHKSKNIQPWSGISMHPIEGIMYESATLIPLLFQHHPIIHNIVKIDLCWAAALGHDGHEFPAAGDWFHNIHHQMVKGNYGSPNAPFDLLFGTVDYGENMDLDGANKKYREMI